NAPAISDSSRMGRAVEVCTSATMSGDGAIDVISHDAPTAWIRLPKFDTRLAIQIARKIRDRNGASVAEAVPELFRSMRSILSAGVPWRASASLQRVLRRVPGAEE